MAQTVSLSTRVPPEVRDRLIGEARSRGVPLSAYTRALLAGASPLGASAGDGSVVAEVESLFAGLPAEAALRREICLAWARTVEAGGTAGITAGKNLLAMVQGTRSLFSDYLDGDEDAGD
jgi:hypothetical protein